MYWARGRSAQAQMLLATGGWLSAPPRGMPGSVVQRAAWRSVVAVGSAVIVIMLLRQCQCPQRAVRSAQRVQLYIQLLVLNLYVYVHTSIS